MRFLRDIVLGFSLLYSSVGLTQDKPDLEVMYSSGNFKGLETILERKSPSRIRTDEDAVNALRLAHVKLKMKGGLKEYTKAGALYKVVGDYSKKQIGSVDKRVLCSSALGSLIAKRGNWDKSGFKKNAYSDKAIELKKWLVDKSDFYSHKCDVGDLVFFYNGDSLFFKGK
jgi:hypothetical protein